jgi:hypothetical protein
MRSIYDNQKLRKTNRRIVVLRQIWCKIMVLKQPV